MAISVLRGQASPMATIAKSLASRHLVGSTASYTSKKNNWSTLTRHSPYLFGVPFLSDYSVLGPDLLSNLAEEAVGSVKNDSIDV